MDIGGGYQGPEPVERTSRRAGAEVDASVVEAPPLRARILLRPMPSTPKLPALAALVALVGPACGGAPADVTPADGIVARPATSVAPASPSPRGHDPVANGARVPGNFGFLVEAEGTWIVLAALSDDALVAGGARELSARDAAVHVVEAPLRLADLPAELTLSHRPFALYEGSERRCELTAGPVRGLGVTSDPFDWSNGAPEDASTSLTSAQRAEVLWQNAGTFIAVRVGALPEGCRGATWARLAELPAPRFAAKVSPGRGAPAARSEFVASAAYADIQRTYTEALRNFAPERVGEPWETAAQVHETSWRLGDRTFLVQQSIWHEVCAANGALTMVWEDGDGAPRRLFAGDDRFVPEVVVDLDGDGALEAIGERPEGERELRPFWDGRTPDGDAILSYRVPVHGCSC